ncbi:hypothetical protein M513_12686 [Trichuris suis]|uniref:Uncharacterized protein n=1 Tax=Trichuris suis TaxID=68888 RepID=A0A085LN75_9BILA|nr:hypothetical protein M513_12686 [Trichuris suis]
MDLNVQPMSADLLKDIVKPRSKDIVWIFRLCLGSRALDQIKPTKNQRNRTISRAKTSPQHWPHRRIDVDKEQETV